MFAITGPDDETCSSRSWLAEDISRQVRQGQDAGGLRPRRLRGDPAHLTWPGCLPIAGFAVARRGVPGLRSCSGGSAKVYVGDSRGGDAQRGPGGVSEPGKHLQRGQAAAGFVSVITFRCTSMEYVTLRPDRSWRVLCPARAAAGTLSPPQGPWLRPGPRGRWGGFA